jgi:hypothetical protein
MFGNCAFAYRGIGGPACKAFQTHDSTVSCYGNECNCGSFVDERMVGRYFRCVICPSCSKYNKCWTYEEYRIPAGPQGVYETVRHKLCHNLCTKAPNPPAVDGRYS